MKLYLYQAIFTLLVAVYCEGLFKGDQVLRIHAETEDHLEVLNELRGNRELDFWTDGISTTLPIDIRMPHTSLNDVKNFLNANKIPFTVMIYNVQDLLAEMESIAAMENSTKSFNFAAYHTLDEIYSWMDTLVATHSNVVSKAEIGRSYENRPMYVLKFSTGRTRKPAIWIDAGIHAREWISPATAVWVANRIATDFANNRGLVPKILSVMDIYMLIVTNPDGYVFSHTSPNLMHRMWRKNRSVAPNSKCRGVDLNRNWDAKFGGPGASNDPCTDIYHGPYANSEIEVKNIVDLIKGHGNFKSFISIHSYSQLIMYPYGYTCTHPRDRSEFHTIGTAAASKLRSLYNTTYRVGSICNIIYPASGGSIDWTYDIGIKYSFTFELRDTGRYGFLLPANQIIPTAKETWLALKYIMKYVHNHPY